MDIQSLLNTNTRPVNVKQMPLFQEGKYFFGKVSKLLANDFAWINVAGKSFSAKLEAPLSVGHGYWFRVEKSKPYPHLKVVISSANLRGDANVQRSIDMILNQFGFPQSAKHREIVSFLMREGLPFSKGFFQEVVSWMTGSDLSSNLSTLKMMLTSNLPKQEGVFHALHRFVTRNDNLMTEMQVIMKELATVQAPSSSLKQLIEQLSNTLKMIDTPIEENGESFSLPFKRLITSLGLRYENVLFHVLKGTLPANQLEEQLTTLKPILLALLQEEIPSKAKQSIQEMIHRLTGQQLLLKTDDTMLQLLFQLPLPDVISRSDLFVHFQGKQKNKKIDADFCRILFYLDLETLKETVVDVHIQNRMITIRIYNDNAHLLRDIKPLESHLKTRLHQTGYQLSQVQWSKSTDEKMIGIEHPSLEFPTHYQGVDLKI